MDLTKAKLLAALNELDPKERSTREWSTWESNRAYKYPILHGTQRYPVKKIVSLATALPVAQFSGGVASGDANQLVERSGL